MTPLNPEGLKRLRSSLRIAVTNNDHKQTLLLLQNIEPDDQVILLNQLFVTANRTLSPALSLFSKRCKEPRILAALLENLPENSMKDLNSSFKEILIKISDSKFNQLLAMSKGRKTFRSVLDQSGLLEDMLTKRNELRSLSAPRTFQRSATAPAFPTTSIKLQASASVVPKPVAPPASEPASPLTLELVHFATLESTPSTPTAPTAPIDQQWQKFYQQLHIIKEKQAALHSKGYKQAAQDADQLHQTLITLATDFNNEKIDLKNFEQQAKQAIDAVRPRLERHYGWKQLLANIALCIAGLGVVYLVAGSIHKAKTGHFLFFGEPLETEKPIADLTYAVNQIKSGQ